jgi:DNA-directed RNA polymerase specialized sigma24 family protein
MIAPMSSDEQRPIAAEFPHLRRYARALLGAQAEADAHISATLRALLGEGRAHLDTEPARMVLFRAFHRLNIVRPPAPGRWADLADVHLQGLSIGRRQALLLVAMEGFSPADAAVILDIAPSDILSASASAGNELAARWPPPAAASAGA